MSKTTRTTTQTFDNGTVGLDVGDRTTSYCVIDHQTGEVLGEGSTPTTREGLAEILGDLPPMRVVQETGTHCTWIHALVERLGHESIVAQAGKVALIHRNQRKSDQVDAMLLARLGRVDPELLSPVRPRSLAVQRTRALLTARAALVRNRTALVSAARSLVKVFGLRLPQCSTKIFHREARRAMEDWMRPFLEPLLYAIEALTVQINELDRRVSALCAEQYPETARLSQVPGVGDLTALAYVVSLGDPTRFKKSRDVGAYVGLVPRRDQSGDTDKQLRITKAGDVLLRTLLVQCAHHIVRRNAPDSRLKRWARARFEKGGASRKKRTVVAVARKLAVMLHRLWVSGEAYDPLHGCGKRKPRAKDASPARERSADGARAAA